MGLAFVGPGTHQVAFISKNVGDPCSIFSEDCGDELPL